MEWEPMPFTGSTNHFTLQTLATSKVLPCGTVFASVSEDTLIRIAQNMSQICLSPRARLMQHGDTIPANDWLYLVEQTFKGKCKLKLMQQYLLHCYSTTLYSTKAPELFLVKHVCFS